MTARRCGWMAETMDVRILLGKINGTSAWNVSGNSPVQRKRIRETWSFFSWSMQASSLGRIWDSPKETELPSFKRDTST